MFPSTSSRMPARNQQIGHSNCHEFWHQRYKTTSGGRFQSRCRDSQQNLIGGHIAKRTTQICRSRAASEPQKLRIRRLGDLIVSLPSEHQLSLLASASIASVRSSSGPMNCKNASAPLPSSELWPQRPLEPHLHALWPELCCQAVEAVFRATKLPDASLSLSI